MRITRTHVLGAALAALAIGAALVLVRAIEWVDVDVPIPPKAEVARDRFYAAKGLVRRLGGTVVAPRSFERLPPVGATLLLSSPHWNLFPGRADALGRWVEGGGRLVLAEVPWFREGVFPEWIPIRREDDARPSASSVAGTKRRSFEHCRAVREPDEVIPAFIVARSYRVCGYAAWRLAAKVAPQWSAADLEATRMLRVPLGQGSVTVSVMNGVFTNEGIVDDDGALAFAAVLGFRSGDEVWFVDEESRLKFFTWLWQTGAPAVLLAAAAIALALWRGGARFGPLAAEPERARRSIGEQIRRTAAFIAGGGGAALHRAALHALEAAAERTVPGYSALPGLAERAAAIAHAAGGDATRLVAAMQAPARRQLAAHLAELELSRRALLTRARRPLDFHDRPMA